MHLTPTKITNSKNVENLRKCIFGISSSIIKYTDNPRVEKQLANASSKIIVSAPKKQEDVPSRVDERPELMNAKDTARRLGNLARSEHSIEMLEGYKNELVALKNALKVVAPKSEFNKHKLD